MDIIHRIRSFTGYGFAGALTFCVAVHSRISRREPPKPLTVHEPSRIGCSEALLLLRTERESPS